MLLRMVHSETRDGDFIMWILEGAIQLRTGLCLYLMLDLFSVFSFFFMAIPSTNVWSLLNSATLEPVHRDTANCSFYADSAHFSMSSFPSLLNNKKSSPWTSSLLFVLPTFSCPPCLPPNSVHCHLAPVPITSLVLLLLRTVGHLCLLDAAALLRLPCWTCLLLEGLRCFRFYLPEAPDIRFRFCPTAHQSPFCSLLCEPFHMSAFLSSPFRMFHTCSSVSFPTISAPTAICLLWPSRILQVSMALLSSRLTWIITSGHCQICIFRQLKHNLFHLNLSHVPPRLFLNRCRISQSMELVFHPASQPDLISSLPFPLP